MDSATFLERYGFELQGQTSQRWVDRWSRQFPSPWIPAALLEALYQGRYKATSVEQILRLWQRRGAPHLTFPPEMSRSLWREQEELIRSLSPTAASFLVRPPSPLSASSGKGSRFAEEAAISLELLLAELQDLPPKLRHLLRELQPAFLACESELSVTLELQPVDSPAPASLKESQVSPSCSGQGDT
jgi:hypothetical protein